MFIPKKYQSPSQSLFVDGDLNINHFSLHNNYPNPFNPSTTIHYEIIDRSLVELYIHDIYGNMIINLVKEVQLPGMRSIQWDANNSLGNHLHQEILLHHKI